MTALGIEGVCQECDGPNVCWFVASPLWNAAISAKQRGLILCPACFVAAFEAAGCGNVAWELRIDPGTAHHLRDDLHPVSLDNGHE